MYTNRTTEYNVENMTTKTIDTSSTTLLQLTTNSYISRINNYDGIIYEGQCIFLNYQLH